MEEMIGWLLPFMIAVSLAAAVCSADNQRLVRTSCLIAAGVTLTGTGVWLVWRPVIHWGGPVLFTLDSFHQLSFDLRLTLAQLPLLWVVWWWMADDPSNVVSPVDRRLRQAALTCLLLMLLADNLWLWYGALAAFSLFQQSLINRGESQDFRLTGVRGCHWIGVLLLLISVGIVTFDLRCHDLSVLIEKLEKWDTLPEVQQANLALATSLAALSVLLLAGSFPISALRIDRSDAAGLEILSVVAAGAVCLQFVPLISLLDVTAAHRSLLLLTVLLAMICSWQQPTVQGTRRAVCVAFLMLGLMGLLMDGGDAAGRMCRILGLQQVSLSLMLWLTWEAADREREYTGHEKIAIGVACALVLTGASGWSSSIAPTVSNLFGPASGGVVSLLVATGLTFGLVKTWDGSVHLHRIYDFRSSAAGKASSANRRSVILLVMAAVITISVLAFREADVGWSYLRAIESLAGAVAGATAALWIVSRRRKSKPIPVSPLASRLMESQFHLVSIWQGVVQFPGMVLSVLIDLWEIGRLQLSARVFRGQPSARNETPFVWELGLGLASLMVLSYLFLWIGE